MLHVFNVNQGTMLTFDVNLAMERVLELKSTILEYQGISPDKQVMLISGGQALCDDERVCSYAAGTESNPVYLFDKGCIEKENIQLQSSYQESNDFAESIRNARTLSPSYKTVEIRTKLAMRLHDATRHQAKCMKSLVHDEHLMFQGWQAAVSNLMETVRGFQTRVETMCAQCHKLFQHGTNNGEILKGMDNVFKNLEQIPILPALLRNISSNQHQVTLLHWIKTQCKNISVQSMYNECKQKQEYLSKERYQALIEECSKVDSQASNTKMSEISGINERLAALDHLIVTAEQQVKEQTGIAQGFVRNRETARELHNNSSSIDALLTLCESHITQLQIMSEYESMTRDALHKCTHAKNELAANLHTRLRWLYVVQRSILNADVKLSMFTQQLTLLQRQILFLDQVKQSPTLYLSSVAEVVRRKRFADNYVQCANKAVAEARVERDREIVKRKTFHSNLAGHFIQRLFHGLSDKPPSLAKKPMRSFDNNLPNITNEHLNTLSKLLPDYKDILKIQEQSINQPRYETTSSSISLVQQESTTSLVSPTTSTIVQSKLDTLTESSKNIASLLHMGDKEKLRSTTGSFAMVGHSTIAKSQPGGFVVTSVENVTQANLNLDESSRIEERHDDDQLLSQENYPSLDHTAEHQKSSPSTSPTDQDQPDSVFAQIGDIISPDSPPDSEFFSIMPGSYGSNRTIGRPSLDGQLSTPGTSPTGRLDVPDIRRHNSVPRTLRQSLLAVGSPDSNTSTSYQKVDGISSDEEMFHSFSSDQDVKQLRKKLVQLQTEFDNLTEESRLEKEELNSLIRKLSNEISNLEENQRKTDNDYEKRWEESKSELDNVIKQLENERLERKKAWTEGANLEKKVKIFEEENESLTSHIQTIQKELADKNLTIQELENAVRESESRLSSALQEAERKIEEIIMLKETQYQKELQSVKTTSSRFERDLANAQAELSTSEDRIQELETALSDHERKQQEDAVHVVEFETRICELERELGCARESFQKSTYEKSEARQKVNDSEQKLAKAHDQIESLKRLLVDYETRLNDDKTKEDLLKNLKLSLHNLELEKLELTSNLDSSRKEIENLKDELNESEKTIRNLRSIGMQDEQSHKDDIEKLKSVHEEELKSVSDNHKEEVKIMNDKHEEKMEKIAKDYETVINDKEQDWKSREESMRNAHRNEIDELEADRLASIAGAQQSIEDLREKLREINRTLDNKNKELIEMKDQFSESQRKSEEDYSSILSENQGLLAKKAQLEQEIIQFREEIKNLQDKEKQDMAVSTMITSTLTSSTDEEMQSKRSKIDSGISDDIMDSMVSTNVDTIGRTDANGNRSDMMTMSVVDHKREIDNIKKAFEEDKKALQSLFKRKEEESARRRQMVFNSAIQRVTSSKDLEIEKLKEQVMSQSRTNASVTQSMMVQGSQPMTSSISHSTTSPSSLGAAQSPFVMQASTSGLGKNSENARDRDKAAVVNFQIGDNVLVCFNETYQHFTLLTTSRTLYFVHSESLDKLGINISNPDSKKSMTFATLVDKEYCQARKAQNRFRVPINTKFYRVKVSPLLKKDVQSYVQSS